MSLLLLISIIQGLSTLNSVSFHARNESAPCSMKFAADCSAPRISAWFVNSLQIRSISLLWHTRVYWNTWLTNSRAALIPDFSTNSTGIFSIKSSISSTLFLKKLSYWGTKMSSSNSISMLRGCSKGPVRGLQIISLAMLSALPHILTWLYLADLISFKMV